MKGKRYGEEQIVRILREIEGGKTVISACQEYGVSEQTVYRWKSKYGGLSESEVKRLKDLTEENGRLKRLLAEAMLDNAALKEIVSKKW